MCLCGRCLLTLILASGSVAGHLFIPCHAEKARTGTPRRPSTFLAVEHGVLRRPEHVLAFSAIPVADGGRRDEDGIVLTVLQVACTLLQDHGRDGAARKASVQSGSALVFSLRVVSRMPRAQCKVYPMVPEKSSRCWRNPLQAACKPESSARARLHAMQTDSCCSQNQLNCNTSAQRTGKVESCG